jgi:hypothetical protein
MRNNLLTVAIALTFATAPVLAEGTGGKAARKDPTMQVEGQVTQHSTTPPRPIRLADEQLDTVAAGQTTTVIPVAVIQVAACIGISPGAGLTFNC